MDGILKPYLIHLGTLDMVTVNKTKYRATNTWIHDS